MHQSCQKKNGEELNKDAHKDPLQRASTSALMCSPLSVSVGLSDNLLIV